MDWLRARGSTDAARLDVDGELTIGRGQPGLGPIADDVEMSRRHARFTIDESGRLAVEDLGSANGTSVNGRQISTRTRLRPGDVVELGGTELEVVAGTPPPAPRDIPSPDVTRVGQQRPRPHPPATPAPPRQVPAAPPPPEPRRPEPVPVAAPAAQPPAGAARPSVPYAGAAPPRGRDSRVAVLGGLLALAIIGLVASLVLGAAGDDAPAASVEPPYQGTVYTLTNRVQRDANSVVAIRYGADGFAPLRMREYPTGGSGSTVEGDNPTAAVPTDGDQQLQVDTERKLLFAVNQGSDSIAVFKIAADGGLTPVKGSPFASGGKAPISVGLSEDTVIVVNKGLDGQRKLDDVGTIAQFQLGGDGTLTPLGTPQRLAKGAGPAQALVIDRADVVVVPELVHGTYRTLLRGAQGTFKPGPTTRITDRQRAFGIPLRDQLVALAPPGTRIPQRLPTPPQGAEGLSVHPEQDIIYSAAPPFSLLLVHTFDRAGNLRFERGVEVKGGLLSCWSAVSPDGRTLYVSVAGTHMVAVFDLTDPKKPVQIQSLALDGLGGHTFNLQIEPSGKRLFVLDSWEPDFDQPGFGNQVHVLDIGEAGMLSTPKQGALARLPVLNGTSSFGLAVVSRESLASDEQ